MLFILMARRRTLIEEELKQGKPFQTPSQIAFVGLLRTVDVLRRSYYSIIEKAGLTPQQYMVLRILRGAGSDGLPTLEIADRMVERSPGITRFVDQLESRGLLKRRRSAQDRRRVFCVITKTGKRLVDQLDAPVDEWDHRCLAMLTKSELETMIRLMDRIRLHYAQIDTEHSGTKKALKRR